MTLIRENDTVPFSPSLTVLQQEVGSKQLNVVSLCSGREGWYLAVAYFWKKLPALDKMYVRTEEVLLTDKEQRNILHEISKQKANWIGQILCRNCLQQQVIEGKIKGEIEVTGS
jgi:hypothetical protein